MYELESFIIFILAVAILIFLDRKKIKLEGIAIIRRTELGKKFIENLADRHPRFWNGFMTLAVIAALPVMIFAFFFLLDNAIQIVLGSSQEGAMLILPGAVSQAETHPGLLIMPWYFWVIGIFCVLIPHEFSHGIASRLSRIKIKSLGWLLLLFLPGAFVEPDEARLKKAKRNTKLRVYAAGSFANLMVAGIAMLASLLLTSIFFQSTGVMYGSVFIDQPMYNANATGSIISINGIHVASMEQLSSVLSGIQPNSTVTLQTTKGIFLVNVTDRPDGKPGAYLGIGGPYDVYKEPKDFARPMQVPLDFMRNLIGWIFILSLGIGIINLLPLKPFDGGMIMEALTESYFERKKSKMIVTAVSLASAAILLFNIIGPYIFRF
jgi:membrane-associated protease RseP (regulator of RpoE activity)